MTETPCGLLGDTLRRLDPLLESRGLTREDVLDMDKLSAATGIAKRSELPVTTGLSRREISTLLKGGEARERPAEEVVPERVRFLHGRLLQESGRRPDEVVHEVAAVLKVSPARARGLLRGEKCPDTPHLRALAGFFGVPPAFFTDSAADALARELAPIVGELEAPDPLDALMEECGIREIHARTEGRRLTQSEKTRIAEIIRLALGGEEPQR